MPFGYEWRDGCIDGGFDWRRERGSFGVNVGHTTVANGDFVA